MRAARIHHWLACAVGAFLLGTAGCQALPNHPSLRAILHGDSPIVRAANPQPIEISSHLQPVAHAVLGAPVVLEDNSGVIPLERSICLMPLERVIDLETALALAGADNPTIALAQEAIRATQALQLQANVLLLPNLDAGASVDWHRGTLISSQGIVRNVERQSAYVGGGAFAVGGGTVGYPGVRLTAHLGDALFEPAATRQQVIGRTLDAQATQNQVLRDVAIGYLALAGAEARLQANRQSETEFATLAKLTADFAKTGQGRDGDAERARSEMLLLLAVRDGLQEEAAVAAAELARLLSVDPSANLRARAAMIPLFQFVDPNEKLENLVQTALANRPEVGARAADVSVVQTRLRKDRVRPFVPFITVGFSAGGFGGGSNQADSSFAHFSGRTDFDAMAVWSLQNFGFGNLAIQRQLKAEVGAATAEQMRVIDQIRREVADAFALIASRRAELDVARQRVEAAQRAYQQDLVRAKNLEGRPIEVLNSANLLNSARQDLIRVMIDYDQAQFAILVALGQPPASPFASAGQLGKAP